MTVSMSALFKGWHNDPDNSRLQAAYNGTAFLNATATAVIIPVTLTSTGVLTATAGLIASAGNVALTTGTLSLEDGGAVVQATSRSTGVTLSKYVGKITTTADSLAAVTIVTFTVTNTLVAATDTIILTKVSGDVDTNAWVGSVGAGSYTITLRNNHASGADTTAFVMNAMVLKGAIA